MNKNHKTIYSHKIGDIVEDDWGFKGKSYFKVVSNHELEFIGGFNPYTYENNKRKIVSLTSKYLKPATNYIKLQKLRKIGVIK